MNYHDKGKFRIFALEQIRHPWIIMTRVSFQILHLNKFTIHELS